MQTFGIVGCGRHAVWAVIPAMERVGDIQLVAVADLSAERLAQVKYSRGELRRYTDYKEMLRHEVVDVVYVATNCEAHCEPVVAALEAGRHVVTEKPMAMSLAMRFYRSSVRFSISRSGRMTWCSATVARSLPLFCRKLGSRGRYMSLSAFGRQPKPPFLNRVRLI